MDALRRNLSSRNARLVQVPAPLRNPVGGCVNADETEEVKMIVYAGAELLTGDEIAIGVLRYCEALAGSVVAEIIEIPVREADGSLGVATLLVGPSSQMVVKSATSQWDEVHDVDVMRRLGERTRAQTPVARTEATGERETRPTPDGDAWETEY